MLEKQLSSSSSSTGDLLSKMCDMNEKVEHLMACSLKLTEQLSASKRRAGSWRPLGLWRGRSRLCCAKRRVCRDC